MKILIYILIVGSLIYCAHGQEKTGNCLELLPYDTIIPLHSNWTKKNYKKRLQDFRSDPIEKGDVIFIGDSHTQSMGDWNQKLKIKNAINRGIGGDITEGVRARLDEVICAEPSKVFLLIGTNDVLWTKQSDDEIVANIIMIVKKLNHGLPQAEIILNTLMPINEIWQKKPVNHSEVNVKITKINNQLKEQLEKDLEILDLAGLVMNSEGFLQNSLTTDGVHLNKTGKMIWISEIRKKL